MDKLLLTLTLVAFSSGVLCNVARNLTEGGPTADSVLPRIKVMGGHEERECKINCCTHNVPHHFVFLSDKNAYKLHMTKLTWNEARGICMEQGALLAIIPSEVDGAKMANWMRNEGVHDTWIGTHDMFEQGQWVTLTGEPLAKSGYDKWLSGEPNNFRSNERCGTLVDENGMNDLTCSKKLAFFCQIVNC